ncbi:unnamed protein product [Caenorhabditis auriculariae]|uniref:RNA polymerase II-associated protein 3 n=1 Tax=Caenorhabditis auriculariae TaxID=2777116 RepID=A0A8S1H5R2_9PELO|nr:unnamed protein product [Caenorhabditis auriculariae]
MSSEEAKFHKEKGNEAFKQKRYHAAVLSYTKSLESSADPVVFGNRAQAFINLKQYLLAQMDCSRAIELDPKLPKAYYRRSLALKELGLYEEARKDAEKCLRLAEDPSTKKLLDSLIGKTNAASIFLDIPIECDAVVPVAQEASCSTQNDPIDNKKSIPTLPKTFADFAADANYLSDSPDLFAQYFLQIPESDYSSLFDDLITTESVALLLKGLALLVESQRVNVSDVTRRLLALSQVSRFELVTMFLGANEKQDLAAICAKLPADESTILFDRFFIGSDS